MPQNLSMLFPHFKIIYFSRKKHFLTRTFIPFQETSCDVLPINKEKNLYLNNCIIITLRGKRLKMTKTEMVKQKQVQAAKELEKKYPADIRINIGMATCEIAAGSKEVWKVFEEAIKNGEIKVDLGVKGCAGRCCAEPTIEVLEKGKVPVKYAAVTPEMAREIIESHVKNHEPVKEFKTRQ